MNRTHDHRFEEIAGLEWLPWIGNAFDGGTIRPLLIGDSHYSEETLDAGVTRKVIREMAMRGELKFMNGCRAVVTGLPSWLTDPAKVWDALAFCNLLQEQLSGSRTSGEWTSYVKDADLIPKVIEIVKPTHIVGFGNNVWYALVENGCLVNTRNMGERFDVGRIGDVPYLHIRHPSSVGFSWSEWARRFGRFLKDDRVAIEETEAWVDAMRLHQPSGLLSETAP